MEHKIAYGGVVLSKQCPDFMQLILSAEFKTRPETQYCPLQTKEIQTAACFKQYFQGHHFVTVLKLLFKEEQECTV